MKGKLRLLLALILISVGASCLYAANPNNSGANTDDKIYFRPVLKDTTFVKDGKTYWFFKDTYVRVEANDKGNIIIGKDTLATDNKGYVGHASDQKKSVDKEEYIKSRIPGDSLRLLIQKTGEKEDTSLVFNFRDLSFKGKIKIYADGDGKPRGEVKTGENDTIPLAKLGLAPSVFASDSVMSRTYITLVPDTIVAATYIPFAEIKPEVVEITIEDEVPSFWTSTLFKVIIGVLLAVIIGLLIFIFCYRRKNSVRGSQTVVTDKPGFDCEGLFLLIDQVKVKSADTSKYLRSKYYKNKITDGLIDSLKSYARDAEDLKDLIKANYQQIPEDTCQECEESIRQALDTIGTKKNFKNIDKLGDIQNELDRLSIKLNSCLQNIHNLDKQDSEQDEKNTERFMPKEALDVNALQRDLRKEKEEREKVAAQLAMVNKQLTEMKQERDEVIKRKVRKAEEECESRIQEEKRKAQEKIASAQRRADQAEEKSRNIRNELNDQFDKERQRAKEERGRIEKTLSDTKTELSTVTSNLQTTTDRLNQSERRVQNLTAETASFKKHLSGVTDSQPYCENILKLVDLASRIQDSATALLEGDIDDKYFIYKPLALYFGKLNKINLPDFYTDVEMVSKTGFVIKGTPLATYDVSLPKSELESLTKNFFFTTYLKTYLDAIVVLNESLAGVHYLIDDVSPEDVRVFTAYRQQIETLAKNLGISILTVKVFDPVGTNTDLQAVEVDAGISKHGAILEIENCKVSLIGGAPNKERIKVKIQK